jgi:hypothetical protein
MITKIITHNRPHADELVALMLLKKFPQGEEKFSGVSTAEVSFLTTGELPNGQTAKDFPDTVFLGCGGGDFDEHATSQKGRTEGECCATLVAKYLGINMDPALQKILTFIKSEDLKGSVVKNELPTIIKLLHSFYKDEYFKISKWVEDAYYAIYNNELDKWNSIKEESNRELVWKEMKGKWQRPTLENILELLKGNDYKDIIWWEKFVNDAIDYQKSRFIEAQDEFKNKAVISDMQTKGGQMIRVCFVNSDNEEMNKYARSIGMHVVLQINSRGNCLIMTDRKKKIDLSYSFVLIRMAEQYYRDGIKMKDQNILSKEGFVDGIPYWYLFKTKEMGFNGSLTTTDVEPTKIPHNKLFELLKEGLK